MSAAQIAVTPAAVANTTPDASTSVKRNISRRENGKNWHPTRTPFRPTSSLTPYAKRKAADEARAEIKARENGMRREKQEAKDEMVRRIKEKREQKAERQRFEEMEARMHRKRVERFKRREKRNKALKS